MRKIKLGDVLDVKRGCSLSGEYYALTGKYIRLTLGNFNYPDNGFKRNVSKDNIFYNGPIKPEFILQKGDVITPLTEQVRGLLGNTATIPESDIYIQSGDIGLVKPSNLINSRFAYYLISSPIVKKQLDAGSQQTKIRHTSPGAIKNCIAYIPEYDDQIKISKLLDDINQKIRINNRINDNLLQSLIVFFDRIMTKSLNSGEANPNKLANVCTFTSGYPFKTENYVKNGIYKLYTIKNVQNGFIESNVDSYLDNIPKDMDPKCLLSFMDILISLTGNVGRSGLVYDDNCLLNQRVLKINVKEDLFSWIYILLQNHSFIDYAVKVATGTSQKNLSPSQVGDFLAIIPSNKYLKEFNDIAQPTLRKIALNNKENLHLKKQRDYLLPLLLNGQVTIR